MTPIDVRSDTVTRPSRAMREAMANAEVGDDVYGEDPSVRALEEYTAELLGKPAALFVPSGTMANQLALLTQTRPGNEVVVGAGAHIAWHEAGAGAAWAGVQFIVAGTAGTYDASECERALKPKGRHLPATVLACLENTHNLAGGRIFPKRDILAIRRLADARSLRLHLDGARLWHACAATQEDTRHAAAPFDSVSVCFSKGLGAPVGSALAGDRELIQEAWRFRKMLGGGMRQAGILAAGALYAVRHHLAGLLADHEKAQRAAVVLNQMGAEVSEPETNIVMVKTRGSASDVVARGNALGVLFHAMADDCIRLVMHRDLTLQDALLAAERTGRALEQAAPRHD